MILVTAGLKMFVGDDLWRGDLFGGNCHPSPG